MGLRPCYYYQPRHNQSRALNVYQEVSPAMDSYALNTCITAWDATVTCSSAVGDQGERTRDTGFKGNKIVHHEYTVANSLYLRIFTAYISIPLLQAVKNKSCK